MKLVICIIIDRSADALLLTEQSPSRGYWLPVDEVKPGETRLLTARRIANKVNSHGSSRLSLVIVSQRCRFARRMWNCSRCSRFDATTCCRVCPVFKRITCSAK